MTHSTRTLPDILAALGSDDTFATGFSLDVDADPGLRVDDVDDIPLPITAHTAHRLCAAAQPAAHGYKTETRLDTAVRDTWEIPAHRIRITSSRWQSILRRALERIRDDLSLPSQGGLTAELHNLLIYGPGQFFSPHQDSEKADGMLATLVVTLPSDFSGGEFVVSHRGRALDTRGSANRLNLMAFYTDCRHEVRRVEQGYRVVLTYNLVAHGSGHAAHGPAQTSQDVEALCAAVQDFWDNPTAPRWPGGPATAPPDRLVYLLDHQYTQRGLSWDRLKGADAARGSALRAVARKLDADIFLTLADVHETWAAEEAYDRYEGLGDWEAHHASSGDMNEPVLQELIDSQIELRYWVAGNGGDPPEDMDFVEPEEVCLTRDSSDCDPFESEYEGYMGNYGNTVDRWYHRAAVVMWPRERWFILRARRSLLWGMTQISERFAAGDPAQAQAWLRSLLPAWPRLPFGPDIGSTLLEAALPVAAGPVDEDSAAALLEPFYLQQTTLSMTSKLVKLLEARGSAWCEQHLLRRAPPYPQPELMLSWAARIMPALAHAWGAMPSGQGTELASALVGQQWAWLQEHIQDIGRLAGERPRMRQMTGTSPVFQALLRACEDARRPDLRQAITEFLISEASPLETALAVLRAAAPKKAPVPADLALLHARCRRDLKARLAQPERAPGDWSIAPPADCAGELGETLARFLQDPTKRRLEWPLAQAKRQVIHQMIDSHELPVRHETRRKGRPYTLVLEKTDDLFERARAERAQSAHDLKWLEARRCAGENQASS